MSGPAPTQLGSTLPGRLLVLTDRTACGRPLVDVVRAAVEGGAPAVVLRERDLPDAERERLADALRAVVGDGLVLAGPAPGSCHLAQADPLPSPRPRRVGRSCHDAAELAAAADEGCDWVTLSPVWETASKPGYGPALTPDGLCALLPGAPPAYALGGVDTPDRARACRRAGAHGAAVLGAVMRADHPDRVVAGLLAALEEEP